MIKHMLNVSERRAIYQLSAERVPHAVRAGRADRRHRRRRGERQSPAGRRHDARLGPFPDTVSDRYPEVVLGAQAASILQIYQVGGHVMVYLGNHWFTVIGVLRSVTLDRSLDSNVFISLPVAERLFRNEAEPIGDLRARAPERRDRRLEPARPDRRPAELERRVASRARRMRSRRAPPPKGSSRRCCSGSGPSPCSSARSGSRTSW